MSRDVYITRLSSVLPNAAIANDEMENVLGQVNGAPSRARRLVLRNNGIVSRHYVLCPETGRVTHTNAALTAEAVRALCDDDFVLRDIEVLSCGTTRADQLMPNHGVMVHGELGNPACEVVATAGICAAGMTALKYAWLSVRAGNSSNAVATGSETSSVWMRSWHFQAESEARVAELEARPEIAFEKDFLRWMLSDGAGAMLLQDRAAKHGPSLRIEWLEVLSFANELPACMYAGAEKTTDGGLKGWGEFDNIHDINRNSVLAVKQDVKLLNENVVGTTVGRGLRQVVDKHDLAADAIDWFLPHMSSEYFRDKLDTTLRDIGFAIPQERWYTNLATRGNTGAASMYIMLDELFRSGRLEPGQRILCFVPESGRFTSTWLLLTVV